MNAHSGEKVSKRRRVRKGTHSCWECRRRKVKCTFASEEDTICVTCRRRGTKCASQATSERSNTIENNAEYRQWVAASQPFSVGGSNDQRESRDTTGSSPLLTSFPISPTPALTLHGNSIESIADQTHDRQTQQTPFLFITPELTPAPASSHVSTPEPSTNQRITQALLHSLPPRTDIELLLVKISRMSMACYQSGYESRSSTVKGTAKEQTPEANLLYPYAHPVLLARQMLLFAAALQYLSPIEVIPGLTKHHHLIMEEIAESAITMVTTNEALLGTLDGLENITLEGRYHADSGNIRRAWIAMRRAVTVAELLGLHQPGHYRFKVINEETNLIPEDIWASIVSMERGLSLLLGLPTSTSGKSYGMQKPTKHPSQAPNLSMLTMGVTGRIIERNQIHPSQQALEMTREIDRELVKITEHIPSTFWRPPIFANLKIDSVEASFEAKRNWDQMWYYSLVNQLHLPYLIYPSNNPRSDYSRVACVNASREILNREIAIRSFNPMSTYCRIGDFVALVAGMTLMLAHIASHCGREEDNMLIHQRLSDRGTVEQALECMKSMSEVRKDVLSAKCATLLKDLLAVEADAAQDQSIRDVLIIQVPYIGFIRISPEGISSRIPSSIAPDCEPHEDVTIGGIGSFHLNSSKPPRNSNDSGTSTDEVAASQAAATHSINAGPMLAQQHSQHFTQVTPDDIYKEQDQMFPDAAASMDDWVFQGFDTAFFDVLMRGSEEQQLNSAGGVWDI